MNKSPVTLIGNVTRDPEHSTTSNNQSRVAFSVAVENRYFNKKADSWESDTSFFDVTAWRWLADDVARTVEKGMRVIVSGRLDQRSWEDNDGQRRSKVEVVADDIAIHVGGLESAERRVRSQPAAAATAASPDPW